MLAKIFVNYFLHDSESESQRERVCVWERDRERERIHAQKVRGREVGKKSERYDIHMMIYI
jgi:hypothetical protein